jgi:hypothetical protein
MEMRSANLAHHSRYPNFDGNGVPRVRDAEYYSNSFFIIIAALQTWVSSWGGIIPKFCTPITNLVAKLFGT